MDNSTVRAVERVIATMRDNLSEHLTIDDMARVAMYSKFHFSRVFQRVTGVSPGRFLSALRLQRAKQLLLSTSYNVSDISLRVGYTSVGTFSSRFTRSVGLSPTTYRRLGGFAPQIHMDNRGGADRASGTVQGTIWPHTTDQRQLTFIGLFRERIPEGRPAACAILDRPGPYVLEKVPPGAWYLLCHSISADHAESVSDSALGNHELATGTYGPITMRRDMVVNADVRLQPMRALDPPVLLALLDVRKAALSLVASREAKAKSY